MTAFASIIQAYFTAHLTRQRAATTATIHTYADTWRLFLSYLANVLGTPAHQLDFDDIGPEHVTAFLDHLENERQNSISTRNLRLAGIKGLYTFWAAQAPTRLNTTARILAIPPKKKHRPDITYLTSPEIQALLDAIPEHTWTGRRDRALFTLATQTGLRVSELTRLTSDSLTLTKNASYIHCTGKGRKDRTTPLTQTVANVMRTYIRERQTRAGTALFPNPNGSQLSRDAIALRLTIHLNTAQETCPTLVGKHVTIHTLRHTAAMRFLHAGIDTTVIALWLGHESTQTTHIYLHADHQLKQQALDKTRQPDTPTGKYKPGDTLLTWLESL